MDIIKHFYTYRTHEKERWRGKLLLDVMSTEFATRSREYYLGAIRCGVIRINDAKVLEDYIIKENDIINHTVHFHEPVSPKIEILYRERDYIVVNKPTGIPVHPTGGYHFYSVTKSLFKENGVGCINRIDMPVSGVVIISIRNHRYNHSLLPYTKKIYIAKVKGVFPKYCVVDYPIETVNGHKHIISMNGKKSRTIFMCVYRSNGYSLVECQPITGRTHQIRIHLMSIGFPIVNDQMYSGEIEYKEKQESLSDVCDIRSEDLEEDNEFYRYIIANCRGNRNRTFEIKTRHICLHAWKYVFNGKSYESSWPFWAYF